MSPRAILAAALVLAVLATPIRTSAQPTTKVWRIGFFYIGSRQSAVEMGRYGAFVEGMQALGYVEGKHFVLEERFADGDYERLPTLAAELARARVDVIVTSGLPLARVMRQATQSIPIVVAIAFDPVREGIAASLARPGGNVTGISSSLEEAFGKHVDLLKVAVPGLARIGALSKASNPDHPRVLKAIEAVATKLNIHVQRVDVDAPKDFEPGLRAMAKEHAKAFVILGDASFVQHFRQIAELAIKYRLASTYSGREYPDVGGFMSYGPNFTDNFRYAATYVDKILKGAKPAELPFEQPSRLYLTINANTAKAIGLAVPRELLLRADRIIE
jgi:putative ABC transport system substrate-binding protein